MTNTFTGMSENDKKGNEEIFSKILRAGRRTYFFDVRATRADDYYLTVTESKKHTNEDGSFYYKKHKIYLYKEDFEGFRDLLNEVTDYIIEKKGEEVISDTHDSNFTEHKEPEVKTEAEEKPADETVTSEEKTSTGNSFTDVNFEDI